MINNSETKSNHILKWRILNKEILKIETVSANETTGN